MVDEPDAPVEGEKVAMTFSASTDATSRADAFTAFYVWADLVPSESTNPTTPELIFNGEKVEYTDGAWNYGEKKFWQPDSYYRFIGLDPKGQALKPTFNSSTHTLSINGITASADADFCAASSAREYRSGDATSPVDMVFSHQLAKIQFIGRKHPNVAALTQINIVSAELKGLYSTMNWAMSVDNGGVQTINTTNTGELSYTASAGAFSNIDNAHGANIFGELLVVPQDMTRQAAITIKYNIDGKSEQTVSANLNEASVRSWTSGKSITYNFTLNVAGVIEFSEPTIEPWTSKSGGNFLIQ